MTERVIFMKKMKNILCILLSAVLLFSCAYSALALQAEDIEIAEDAAVNYRPCDINNDGYIRADDARVILRLSVALETWSAVASRCNYPHFYNYRAAADPDGDGFITAADARIALRVSVGLEDVEIKENALASKQGIVEFYILAVRAVKCAGYAGYDTKSWQTLSDCNILNICNNNLVKHVNNYITSESEAKTVTYKRGTASARNEFPIFEPVDHRYFKSAGYTVNERGNYVITLVAPDVDTTKGCQNNDLSKVTKHYVTWNEDVAPVLNESNHIKNWSGEKVITKNFTITAELTPNGKFVSVTHTSDAVISAEKLIVRDGLIQKTLDNKNATIRLTTVYNNFKYPSSYKGFNYCMKPSAYKTIDQIGDFLNLCMNRVADPKTAAAGYTRTTSQSVESMDLSCLTKNQVQNYLQNETVTTVKGTTESWCLFPANSMGKYDWVKSASCTVNANGNYVITMVFKDVETSKKCNANILQKVTTDLIYFDCDIAPVLRDMKNVKSFNSDGKVTYKDFTIYAEVTPTGEFVYFSQTANVNVSTDWIQTILCKHENQYVNLVSSVVYTDFTY